MCHHNVFLLYESIERADQTKWDKITHFSLSVSFAISAMFGVAGYATFTGYSQGTHDSFNVECPIFRKRSCWLLTFKWTAFRDKELPFLAHIRNNVCGTSFPMLLGACMDGLAIVVPYHKLSSNFSIIYYILHNEGQLW